MDDATTDKRARRAARVQSRFDPLLLAAAIAVVPTLLLEEAHLGAPWDGLGHAMNWAGWILFAVEVVVMLALVPDRKAWLRAHLLDVAIVVLTPPVAPAALQSLRAFRVLRLLRLVKAVQLTRRLFSLEGLKWAGLVALLTIVGGGLAFAAVERQEQSLDSWDGIWWALTTVTTVGYGDYAPATDSGRIIALVVMGVGIGFVALIMATVAERFVRAGQADQSRRESEHDEVLARLDDLATRMERLEGQMGRGPGPTAAGASGRSDTSSAERS